jgi:hypothetical protein
MVSIEEDWCSGGQWMDDCDDEDFEGGRNY